MGQAWAEHMIAEYRKFRKPLEVYRELLKSRDPQGTDPVTAAEASIVASMVSDMDFAVSWMGRYVDKPRTPKPTRIDRSMFPSLDIEPESRLSEERRKQLLDMLSVLSEREQQCLLLHFAYGLSFAAIGKELCISKAMVQQSVTRAKKKLSPKS